MHIQLAAGAFMVPPWLRSFLDQRLQQIFAPLRQHVRSIVIRLQELSRAADGRDMVCEVALTLVHAPQVVIREAQEDMRTAIEFALRRAAHRAGRLLSLRRRHAAGHAALRL